MSGRGWRQACRAGSFVDDKRDPRRERRHIYERYMFGFLFKAPQALCNTLSQLAVLLKLITVGDHADASSSGLCTWGLDDLH